MDVSHNTHGAASMAHRMSNSTFSSPGSYFSYSEYPGILLSHIVIMTIAWAFILPVGVILSIARSKSALSLQVVFLLVNAIGLVVGTIYNSKTPDLYTNNAHHRLGWALTWIALAQAVLALIRAYAKTGTEPENHEPCVKSFQDLHESETYRYSRDSGHGTESSSLSSRSNSISSVRDKEDQGSPDPRMYREDNMQRDSEQSGLIRKNAVDRYLSRKLSWNVTSRALSYVGFLINIIDRTILILGFIALATGLVTYGGFFKGCEIFSGLAHFIKGGIFFWYGLFSLGRWSGAFAELGWAWNIKPSADIVGVRKAAMPSAEFVESFLIFFYGSTNVFLEHLAAWGSAWSAQDLEHVSISVMFFGGGLCGMLIESKKIRNLLNASFETYPCNRGIGSSIDSWRVPKTYGFSLNPLPGLIIMLLGLMMSSHHQASMVSTMIHKQWGTLFVVAALARGVTYILTYLSPPTSLLPSRPPSEIIVSFCLISGGLIFMASSKDTVRSIEHNDLNAMFIFTVMMGLTAFLMAWTILVMAIKGLAVHRQHGSMMAMPVMV